MKRQLPPRADLQQLKTQAKELLKACKSGDPDAVERMQASHPRVRPSSGASVSKLKLADAQLILAREYGFPSWPALKKHAESAGRQGEDILDQVKRAFAANDAPRVRDLLQRHPALKAMINQPIGPFDSPAIVNACTKDMLDVLLDAGADINATSRWWAGGFSLLDSADPDLAQYAIQRGAVVTVHAAARLAMMDRLRQLVEKDPALVHARGGDGQTPLHFASTVEVAEFLLDHGANIDARDIDHESTPAQHMLRDRQDVARDLVSRACHTDLLMAAALGDIELARKHLDADPSSIRVRVSPEFFPMTNPRAGGTIYQWTLGFHVSAHDVARQFGHHDLLQLLIDRSPPDVRLLTACWSGDEQSVAALLHEDPNLTTKLSDADRRQIADAARNNNLPAVRLMLAAGFPTTARGQHNATPLHWASWHGNADMVRAILAHNPPLEDTQNEFSGTPLRWAIHGSENGWHRQTGDYASTVAALLAAGVIPPVKVEGTEAVRQVLAHGK